jgi:putative Holliday junction resolvase
MDQEMDTAEDIVTLVDEEGKNHDFQVVDIIEVEDKEYALLLPADSDDPEQDEVLVLRFEEDRFEMIEDEAEFQKVVKVLEELNEEEA